VLVVTAIVLARHCIWYDATLLIVLENMFLIVPFILVSQAALIEQRMVWAMCLAAAFLAAARGVALRRWILEMRFSPRLLGCGLGVLTANAALPAIYRILHETKVGTKPTCGAAYEMNEWSWLWLLPALCALANLLPRQREHGELPVQRRWFPVGLFLLWVVATSVHLYCLGYVYDFDLRRELVAPALWVLAWTLHRRLTDLIAAPVPALRTTTLVLPLFASLCAAGAEKPVVFFTLSLLNALAYGAVAFVNRDNRIALHLLLVSVAALVAGLPSAWMPAMAPEFDRDKFLGAAALIYVLLGTTLSRNPKLAFLGVFAAAIAAGTMRGNHADAFHWAAQAGLTYLLLHSLRWRDHDHDGASAVRVLTAVAWVLHSVFWVRDGALLWHPLLTAGVVIVICVVARVICGCWAARVVPFAALLVAISWPTNFIFEKMQNMPMGIAAVAGSFALFGIGTIAALTKHRWNKNGYKAERALEQ
jgi:hypothetical protein